MRKIAVIYLLFHILCIFFSTNVFAEQISVSAKSAILIEQTTGKVLYEKNAHQKMSMASTTKVMTALCAIENANLDEEITVDSKAVGVEGSSIYLAHGEKLTIRELLYGLMLSSGNDAAVAIAIAVSGSIEQFSALMNETAARIGVKNTSFKNPNGLDEEGHYTTAYDYAMITRYAMSNDVFRQIAGAKEKKIRWKDKDYGRSLRNHNKLLFMYDGCTGVKTGFTKKSGRCLVSSATRQSVSVIAVTLNAPDDWNDHMRMFDYAFSNYHTESVIKKGEYVRTVRVVSGNIEEIALFADEDVNVVVSDDAPSDVKIKYEVPDFLEAPVGFEQQVGNVVVYVDGKIFKSIPVISENYVAKVSEKKFLTSLRKIFNEWFYMISTAI